MELQLSTVNSNQLARRTAMKIFVNNHKESLTFSTWHLTLATSKELRKMCCMWQYGLYGSFMGSFMYILLGSCKDVPMGPTAITALLTYTTLRGMGPHYASLLCFLSGIIQLLMGLAGLGECAFQVYADDTIVIFAGFVSE